nr:MAG TPA: phosphoadenosine-phosphosulfate reductase [Caudoviricetes sp.]
MLLEQTINTNGEVRTKLDIAIQRLKSFEPPEGYYVAFSGGKDSQCIYHLCQMAGVKFRAEYHVTSVDPPELIYFIREHYPDVIFDVPHDASGNRISMWTLIVKYKMPPMRIARYCCAELKETAGNGYVTITGVRWAESARRRANHGAVDIHGKPKTTQKKAEETGANYAISRAGALIMNDDNDENRRLVENCYRTQKTILNPIVDWTDEEVWEFLNKIVKVPHCRLYDEGYKRIGCIGCPLAGHEKQKRDFERYPKYRALYVRAFGRMLERCKEIGVPRYGWKTGEDVMQWWLRDMPPKEE